MKTYGISMNDNLLSVMNPITGVSTPIQFEEGKLPIKVAHELRGLLKGCEIKVVELKFLKSELG